MNGALNQTHNYNAKQAEHNHIGLKTAVNTLNSAAQPAHQSTGVHSPW